jgi:hypothetical protein
MGTVYVFIISSKNPRKTKLEYTRKEVFRTILHCRPREKIFHSALFQLTLLVFSCQKNEPGNNLTYRNVHPYCSKTKFLLIFSLNNKIVNRFSTTYVQTLKINQVGITMQSPRHTRKATIFQTLLFMSV